MKAGIERGEYSYAGFWRRLAAGVIDFLILSILPVGWIVVAVMVFGPPLDIPEVMAFDEIAEVQRALHLEKSDHLSRQQRIAGWASNIFSIFFVIGFWTWKGQTPGKMLFGIRIVMTDGSPIGLRTSILRYVGQIIGALLLFVGFLMIAWDRRKQGLHDKLAGTVVVRTW